jgi:hypothetical protein
MQAFAPTAPSAPMREFLVWVDRAPRTYGEAMDAWGSHCPRFTVWEDALGAGLVHIENGVSMDAACVKLTTCGQAALRTTAC